MTPTATPATPGEGRAHKWTGEMSSASYCSVCGLDYRDASRSECRGTPDDEKDVARCASHLPTCDRPDAHDPVQMARLALLLSELVFSKRFTLPPDVRAMALELRRWQQRVR